MNHQFDFTTIMDRRGKDALAVDGLGKIPGFTPDPPKDGFDPIPMWIADMNFPTVPTIPDAIIRRAQHPAYGYFLPTDDYFDAIIHWQESRNHVTGLSKEHIGYENGVLGGVVSALNVLCSRGDKVLVHSPVYLGFCGCLTANGYNAVFSPLVLDENNVWRMDFADIEKKFSEEHIHTTILCSPHNPTGRVWERWELERFLELCKKYDVYVISDEIWSDLTLEGYQHIPTQMVSEDARQRTIAVYAPSKTFNLAGLMGSYHIIYNRYLKDRVMFYEDSTRYNEMNVLSMHSLLGAYVPEGHEWLDQLRSVLTQNVAYACNYIDTHFEDVKVSRPQGTYMLFPDCANWCKKHKKTIKDLTHMAWDVGVVWADGIPFHAPYHIRMNLASPLSRIQEAFDRLDKYVFND